jgi:hypothetical protein
MLGKVFYIFEKGKFVLAGIMASLCLLSACSSVSPYDSSKWSHYNSEDLAKDWRDRPRPQRPQMVYPADNDVEYYLPKKPIYAAPAKPQAPAPVYNFDVNPPEVEAPAPAPVVPRPAPGAPIKAKRPAKPAPQPGNPKFPVYEDSDENYETGYPKYDPEEDNSGYYYQHMDKPLPKPVDDGSGNENYPIYFD